MSVISVIPDTGLEPTIAMALAATVVNKKAITVTNSMPTTAKSRFPSITPNQKNKKVMRIVIAEPMAITLKEMSRCVRLTVFCVSSLPFISPAASDTAPLMMPHDLMIPMIPAMAMPPIPMLLPYEVNICSGDMAPTVAVIDGSHALNTWS